MTGFETLGMRKEIAQAIQEMGFTQPTEIQEAAIPLAMQGEDVIGQAQTGSGKTIAFGIPLLERIDMSSRQVQALVLTPTRELAVQVCGELGKLGRHLHAQSLPIYGGASINPQIDALRMGGVKIVVGTPGRIIDHLERGTLRLDGVKMVVLDEADRMLDMGFIDDINLILSKIPSQHQTMLFSATMPEEILSLAHKYMHAPQQVLVSKDEISVKEIAHYFTPIPEPRARFRAVLIYLQKHKPSLAIIFTRTKIAADNLVEGLQRNGIKAEALHGNLSQRKRDQVMHLFRNKHITVLVASDLAARGLDVSDVSHVINYHLPDEVETYLHRTGRTGRVGKQGTAFSLVLSDQQGLLGAIERFAGITMIEEKIDVGPMPPARQWFGGSGQPKQGQFGGHPRERAQGRYQHPREQGPGGHPYQHPQRPQHPQHPQQPQSHEQGSGQPPGGYSHHPPSHERRDYGAPHSGLPQTHEQRRDYKSPHSGSSHPEGQRPEHAQHPQAPEQGSGQQPRGPSHRPTSHERREQDHRPYDRNRGPRPEGSDRSRDRHGGGRREGGSRDNRGRGGGRPPRRFEKEKREEGSRPRWHASG